MEKVLVIVGPTAVGKTALSIALAKKFNGEIISGDSMQVYRSLDIGTAKVTETEKEGIPHYLIDCREVSETYSAADFQKEGRQKIKEITEKGKLPIIVGETGYSILTPKEKPARLYDYYLLGLETDRALLYERINQRVDQMMTEGLLEEAKQMFQQPHAQAAQGIGYKEFFPYFSGEQSLEMAVETVKQQSRRYAKRQLTWFRNRMAAHWWDLVQQPTDLPKLEKEVAEWLQQKESE